MRFLWRLLRVLVLSYVGVCLVLWLLENMFVYRPSGADDWNVAPAADIVDVELIAADGTKIHAWWLPCPGAENALLYCHGNAGNLSWRGDSIVKMRKKLDVSVLIFDYPGYGKSGGKASEKGCYAAADAAYAWLTGTQKIAGENVLLYGGSLGGGIAVDLATRQPHRALILVKPFTSAPDTGASMFPWLPVRWLMRNRFDNLAKIPACKRPVFIAHGTADKIVPFGLGKRLFEAANEPKEFLTIEHEDHAGHNDPLPEEFFTLLKAFLEKNP